LTVASFRPKYRSLENENPVTTPPTAGAKLPDPVESKPIEPPPESNPVKEAERTAIERRLQETLSANEMAAAPQPPPEPQASKTEQIDQFIAQLEEAIRPLPEEARPWFRQRPEYIFDPEKTAAAQHFHNVAVRETGEHFTPRYFESLERNLGLRRPELRRQASAPSRPAASSISYAAPPTREAPSFSTGRSMSESTVQLTPEEVHFAHICAPSMLAPSGRQMTAREAEAAYLEQKRRMRDMNHE
jgi:hypothetical protein